MLDQPMSNEERHEDCECEQAYGCYGYVKPHSKQLFNHLVTQTCLLVVISSVYQRNRIVCFVL